MLNNTFNELAPCGVYCGACPSYNKTCYGCASEDKTQKRSSKWACKIRNCCYYEKELQYCIHCNQFPCKKHKKKIIDSHPDDIRFTYRQEIPRIFKKLKNLNTQEYYDFQKQRWRCDSCGGTILFYYYRCNKCGKELIVK